MRKSLFAAVLAGSTFAAAQPGMPVEEAPPPPPPPPPVTVSGPPGALPPITININNTNNNTGNNSNTNTQTNNQQNPQTNTQTNEQTNTQTNTVPVTVTTSTTVAPPSSIAPVVPPDNVIGRYELIRPRAKTARWLALGVTTDHGMRASLDLIARGRFSLGIAATASGGEHHGHPGGDGGSGAVAYLAYTAKLGRLDVRAQLGFGLGTSGGGHDNVGGRGDGALARTTTGTDPAPDGDRGKHRFAPRAEAALLLGLPLTRHLGLFGGPVISATRDRDADRRDGGGRHGGSVDKAMTAGLRWSF